VHAPDLYLSGRTDALLLELPGRLPDRLLGELLRAVTAAGAFAAFMSTTSGLLVAVAGALAHDLYARTLHPRADLRERLRAFRFAALLAGAVAMAISLGIERFHINMLVGWAFAIAASAFFPLLVLGIWWRRLTVVGAAAGTLVGGGLASAAILYTMWAGDPLLPATTWSTLLAQPAIWTIPVSFGTMVLGSLLTPHRVPPDVNLKMLRLHVPETLGLRTDYIGE
jgi:Na+(H+)/acetate symporter ActP